MLSALIVAPEAHLVPSPVRRRRRRPRRPGRRVARDRGRIPRHGLGLGSRGRPHRGSATGTQSSPGVVALDEAPRSGRRRCALSSSAAGHRDRRPSQPVASRDGRQAYLLATLKAGADEADVADGLEQRFEGNRDVLLGGALFAAAPDRRHASPRTSAARRLLAFPILLLLSLLFFRGRATVLPLAVGHDDGARHVPRAHVVNQAYDLSIFALNLVIGLGLGPGDRLHAVPRHPLSARSCAKDNPDARRARRWRPPAARSPSAP